MRVQSTKSVLWVMLAGTLIVALVFGILVSRRHRTPLHSGRAEAQTTETYHGDPGIGGPETVVAPLGGHPADYERLCPAASAVNPCRITTSLSNPEASPVTSRKSKPSGPDPEQFEGPTSLGQPAILDAADPSVLVDGQTYFVSSTSARFIRVPTASIPGVDLLRAEGRDPGYVIRSSGSQPAISASSDTSPPETSTTMDGSTGTSAIAPSTTSNSSTTSSTAAGSTTPPLDDAIASTTTTTSTRGTGTATPPTIPTPTRTTTTDPATVERFETMPLNPPWASDHGIWAPSVARFGSRFVMFFASKRPDPPDPVNAECIGRAFADSPDGPFVPEASPFTCGLGGIHGALDPSVFRDRDGRAYLHVAFGGTSTPLWVIPLNSDGDATGAAKPLLGMQQPWESWFLENPSMISDGSGYVLAYSTGDWKLPSYATGVARCTTPMGPCSSSPIGPWLRTTGDASGPGGLSFFTGVNGDHMVIYHCYQRGREDQYGARHTYIRKSSISPGLIGLE